MPNTPILTVASRAWRRTPVSRRGLIGLTAVAVALLGPAAPALLADAASPSSVSVGDRVWVDRNGNGLQDAGEPGIRGVNLTLTDASGGAVTDVDGKTVGGARTDGGGYYSFDDLPEGQYVVHVDAGQVDLRDYKPTRSGVGDRGQDSSTGSAQSSVLQGDGDRDGTLDFGFTADNPRVQLSMNPSAVKDLDGNGPDEGDTIRYGLVVTNTGNTPLSGFQITSPMSLTGLSCPAATLQPDESLDCAPVTYTLTQADVDRGYVTGDTTVTAATPDGRTVTDRDCPVTDSTARAVSVGDLVWLDLDRDGVQDSGEPGISDVVVTIVGPDGRAVDDVYGDPVGTRTTNADGRYVFAKLPALPVGRHYTVRVDGGQAALAGATPTRTGQGDRGTDSSAGSAESGDLNKDGASDLTLDFGFTRPSVSVGDLVWVDTDGDGVQDAGEPGLVGVQVTLVGPNGQGVRDITGAAVGPRTTGADGTYAFSRLPVLPAGQHYAVRVDGAQAALRDYTPTQAGVGDRAKDSSTGSAESTDLVTDGASDPTLDFGHVFSGPAVTLDKSAGPVVDLDGNGPDAGDTITYAFTVTNSGKQTLTKVAVADPKVGPVTCPTAPLAPGASVTCSTVTYTLTTADVRAGKVVNTATVTGTAPDGRTVTDDDSTTTPVVPRSVSVGDFVWVDSDRDGVQDAGEPGLKGVVLTILGPDGQQVRDVRGDAVGPQTTDASGAYRFAKLPALPAGQHYTVRVDAAQAALDGYAPALTGQGTRATDSSTGSAESGDVNQDGASDRTRDFGYVTDEPAVQLDKIAGDIADVNDNGPDEGDEIMFDFAVTNIGSVALDPVSIVDPKVGPVTCPAGPLAPGATVYCESVTYVLTPDDLAAGAVQNTAVVTGTAPDGSQVTDDDSTSTPVARDSVSVGDLVWIDSDRDGVQDAGEPGLDGVVVTIAGPNGRAVTSIDDQPVGPVTTDRAGAYTFDGLPALPEGQHYTVKVDRSQTALVGYVPTVAEAGDDPAKDSSTDSAESIDLSTGGDRDATLDFGFVTPVDGPALSLDKSASAIEDLDGDGPDIGDRITYSFVVTNLGSVVLDPVTVADPKVGPLTCPTGPLAPGSSVSCTPVAYTITSLDDEAGSVENTAVATGVAPDGTSVEDVDSTSTPLTPSTTAGVSVGDFVWVDANRNGVQDAGERGLAGVTVTVVGPNGDAVADVRGVAVGPQVTDVNGAYTFANLPVLPAGLHYTVRVDDGQTALSAYRPTVVGQGTPSTDSSNGSAESDDLTIPGSSDTSLDFGFVPVGDGTAAILLDKQASAIDDVDANGPDAGDRVTYTFVLANTGDRPLTDVTVSDPMVGAVTCPASTLAVGAQMTCTAKAYALTAADVAAGTVENTAVVTGAPAPTPNDPDPAPVADEDSTSTPIAPRAEIVLDKSVSAIQDVDGGGIGAGDLIVYSFEVVNLSNVTIDDVAVTDPKLGVVTCPVTRLAAGARTTCSAAPYVITAADVAAGVVDNTALVDGTTPDGTHVGDDDSTTTDVRAEAPTPPKPHGDDDGDVAGIDTTSGSSDSFFSTFLPDTGGPAMVLLWVSAGAVLAGAALVVGSRRKA